MKIKRKKTLVNLIKKSTLKTHICKLCDLSIAFGYNSGWGEKEWNAIGEMRKLLEKRIQSHKRNIHKYKNAYSSCMTTLTDHYYAYHENEAITKYYQVKKHLNSTALGYKCPVCNETITCAKLSKYRQNIIRYGGSVAKDDLGEHLETHAHEDLIAYYYEEKTILNNKGSRNESQNPVIDIPSMAWAKAITT